MKELINTNPVTPNGSMSRNSPLFEHLECLGEKFDTLVKGEISDYEEMESKIISIVEEFCSLKYMDESVCRRTLYILVYYQPL